MDELRSSRYIRIPIPNLVVGPTVIHLYPDDSNEVTGISLNTHSTVMIDGKRYLVVGEIQSGVSDFTTKLLTEENNIGVAGWWRSKPD